MTQAGSTGSAAIERTLAAAYARREEREWLAKQLSEAEADLDRFAGDVESRRGQADREHQDVRELEQPGLRKLVARFLGSLDERLEKERAEAAAAELGYQAARGQAAELRERVEALRRMLADFADVDAELAAATEARRRWLVEHGGPIGEELCDCAEREGILATRLGGLSAAVSLGHEVENHLDRVLGYLRSAKAWGLSDLLGGPGGGPRFMHASHKREAFGAALVDGVDAQSAMARFKQAVTSARGVADLHIPLPDDLLHFLDWFVDGMAVDLLVQNQIEATLQHTDKVRSELVTVMKHLSSHRDETAAALDAVRDRIRELTSRT